VNAALAGVRAIGRESGHLGGVFLAFSALNRGFESLSRALRGIRVRFASCTLAIEGWIRQLPLISLYLIVSF